MKCAASSLLDKSGLSLFKESLCVYMCHTKKAQYTLSIVDRFWFEKLISILIQMGPDLELCW